MTTLMSFSEISHVPKLHQDELSTRLLFSRLKDVRKIDVVFDSESSLFRDIYTHQSIRTRYGADIILCPMLQLLTLKLCTTHISQSDAEHLLLPLLSEEVMSIVVAVQGNTCTIPMHSLYSWIAKQAPKLEKLLLPNSSSVGLSTSRFPYLNTLTLQDMQGEDASAISSLSRLRDLTVSCQRTPPSISTGNNTTTRPPQMPTGTFPDLENLDLIASNIQALEGLLMLLPSLMTPKSCSFEIRHSDERWDQMLKLLETCISPSKLINLELVLYRESDGVEHMHDWIERGLSTDYLGCFLPYTHLRRLYFSARITEFFIKMTDEDIKQLAMNCPKLVEIVLEGCSSQESSEITLSALMYLAQHLDFEGAPLTLQIPLAAVNRPSLANVSTRMATRNVDLTLPSDPLPIQSSVDYVFEYLHDVMPRIRSLQFGEAFGQQESWTSVAGRIYDRAYRERWPDQDIEEYL